MARVLLLEDEPSVARIIEFKLQREGHEVRRRPLLKDADRFRPDLVLLDLGPGAAVEEWDGLGGRLVALVDAADPDAAGRARQAGAVAVVTKPFKPTVLARLVRELT